MTEKQTNPPKKKSNPIRNIVEFVVGSTILATSVLALSESYPSGIAEQRRADALNRLYESGQDEMQHNLELVPRNIREGVYPVFFGTSNGGEMPDIGTGTAVHVKSSEDKSYFTIPFHPDDESNKVGLDKYSFLYFLKNGQLIKVPINKCAMINDLIPGEQAIDMALCEVNNEHLDSTFEPVSEEYFAEGDSNHGYGPESTYISISSPFTNNNPLDSLYNRHMHYWMADPTGYRSGEGVIFRTPITDGSSGGLIVEIDDAGNVTVHSYIEGSNTLNFSSLFTPGDELLENTQVATNAFPQKKEIETAVIALANR